MHRARSLARNTRRFASITKTPSTTQITTLPNKVRVATENTPGHFSSVGVYVDAGSRYEDTSNSGVSHILDRMAFKGTANFSTEEMSKAVDALGGQFLSSSSRESIMYQSSQFTSGTLQALSLLAEVVNNPVFSEDELDLVRDAARYEVREINAKPEMILPEILHQVAYGGQGLGNPLLCPLEQIDVINSDTLHTFVKNWYQPERIVVAGAGIPHEQLLELTDKHFSHLTSTASSSRISSPTSSSVPLHLLSSSSPPLQKSLARAASSLFPSTSTSSVSESHYTGGHHFISSPESQFSHLYLAFEGVSIHDPDIYALAIIQILLGGGGSFSAGGPGKGMYSRLYTHILNHHPQIDHCASFHHIYSDSSLFGLFATFLPPINGNRHVRGSSPQQILPHLVHQLSLLLHTSLPAEELSRARNQLKSNLVMALESRAVEVEDLGRQILVHNRKVPVSEMCERIDQVTADDIRRVSARVFGPDIQKSATVLVEGADDVTDWRTVLRKYGVGGAQLALHT
ncbi:hypothetical protein SISNIDRAFT_454701 [Sistotremastrum niveocremeum HHB9708]|uniref:Alpha-MPP n=1 Tax=Sistotremastrum niveocremeum HHB9708 TaxID=1314777 RepID=A0A164USN4_9AGAM|nr:hypothetical protein SISNIDRAFT_454701 [Sistotremastrum niveocremeum HHB9708]